MAGNALRHSFASYHLAHFTNAASTALELSFSRFLILDIVNFSGKEAGNVIETHEHAGEFKEL
jgi:hypothetical protein